MKLLSANLIITSLSERKRQKHLLITPVAAVAIISYPLWATNLAPIVSSWMPVVSTACSSTPAFSSETAGMDGFAAYAFEQRKVWQVQPAVTPGDPVDPSSWNAQHKSGGLVGAALDPAFGQANAVGLLADYGYDTARDISRLVTFATAMLAIILSSLRLNALKKKGGLAKGKIAKAIIYSTLLTFIVHMIGTFIINNFGGLGAGL